VGRFRPSRGVGGRDAVPGCDVVMWVGRDPGGWGRSASVPTGLQKVVKPGGGGLGLWRKRALWGKCVFGLVV
jgi:hypothetical protein